MYNHPQQDVWQGRVDSKTDPLSFRYHQKMRLANISDNKIEKLTSKSFGIIGFKCDEGVRRNKGRKGAAEAPDKIRAALAKLPWHLSEGVEMIDFGNVRSEKGRMNEGQVELGAVVAKLLDAEVTPIIFGGGHETFYGHYLGVRRSIGEEAKLGMINIDAHFDMRSYDEQTSSGTMFKQILDFDKNCSYFVAGIQPQGNTLALFEAAKQRKVDYTLEEDVTIHELNRVNGQISAFAARHDYIILTLCMDAISSAYAPGVSAPSPFGLEPKVVRALIRHIASCEKLLSLDVCEVNPRLDEQNKTITLAAHLINEALNSTKA